VVLLREPEDQLQQKAKGEPTILSKNNKMDVDNNIEKDEKNTNLQS
jgi:hypothetical protein